MAIPLSDIIPPERLTWNVFVCHYLACLSGGPRPERPEGRLRYSNDISRMFYMYRSN